MINIKNECYLMIGFGKITDIVNDLTPFTLEIAERMGNRLPEAIMTVVLPADLIPYLATECDTVYISLGFDEEVSSYSKWQIDAFDVVDSEVRFLLTADRAYVNDIAYKVYDGQSCKVIEKVVKEYFEIEDDCGSTIRLTATNDAMKWTQHGNTMREFVDEVWLHSWADNKLMMPIISAFTAESSKKAGTFKLIDMTDGHLEAVEITRKPVANEEESKGGVWLIQDLNYKSNSSIYNTDIGNRKYSAFDIKEAKVETKTIEPKPVFKGDFNALHVKVHNDPIHSISDNVHKNYAKAKASNLSRLSKFTDTKRIVVVDYGRISIGDRVLVTIPLPERTDPNDMQSGVYIVSEVRQRIQTKGQVKTYSKELTLKRDANSAPENYKA